MPIFQPTLFINAFAKSNNRKLRSIWYDSDFECEVPVIKDIVQQAWRHCYLHHVQRLILLSFMIQLQVSPDEIVRWFRCFNIDSTEFIMAFNVYAMGYFERNFTQKPYLFSSQYVYQQSGGRYAKNELQDDLYR